MALQYSVAVRDARLDAVEVTVGTSAILMIRTGSPPDNCAASDTGDVLATLELPSDWMAAADDGTKEKAGTWEDLSADDTGVAAHWRLYASNGTTCHMQGTVVMAPAEGDMIVDNTSFAVGQAFLISAFSLTAGNP